MKDKPNILKSDFSSSKTHSFQHQLPQNYLIGQMEEKSLVKKFQKTFNRNLLSLRYNSDSESTCSYKSNTLAHFEQRLESSET